VRQLGSSVLSALERQEGGDHYKRYAIEPVEFCHRNNLSWCQANVVKYVVRFKDKGGIEDLHKARHYLDMLEEFEYGEKEKATPEKKPRRYGAWDTRLPTENSAIQTAEPGETY
jgi:hypothetical protein